MPRRLALVKFSLLGLQLTRVSYAACLWVRLTPAARLRSNRFKRLSIDYGSFSD